MEGLRRSETAELALGALIIFIAIMITSTIMASVLLLIVETTFRNSQEHSLTQSENLNGIIQVNRFELSEYSNPGNDELYLVFELPYILNEVSDLDVVWSLLCKSTTMIHSSIGEKIVCCCAQPVIRYLSCRVKISRKILYHSCTFA